MDNKPLPEPKRTKKPYHEPQLETYGNLREITEALVSGPNPDGPPGNPHRT